MNSDRLMRNMMQSMGMQMPMPMPMPTPFGLIDDFGFGGQPSMQMHQNPFSAIMPHGFMSPMSMMMMDPLQGMQQAMNMTNNGGGFSYCSSSVTSYTTDEQGRPQVYQQSNEVKTGPSGVKETKSAIRDSRTGHQELAIGHHLNEKGHIKKKSKNVYSGEEEQGETFVGIDESEAESFEQNWARQARNTNTSSYNQIQYGQPYGKSSRNNRLELASSAREDLTQPPPQRHSPYLSAAQSIKSALKSKKKKKTKEAGH